jgi:hypothetical protein
MRNARVVPLEAGRRLRTRSGRSGGQPPFAKPRATAARPRRTAAAPETTHAQASTQAAAPGEGPLVALARMLSAGREGLRWPSLARLWKAVYFSWHSEETDEYGYDPRFAETVRPFFEFLYAI